MSAVRINSSPFKGEVGRGMCFLAAISSIKPLFAPHPHPIPSNRKRRFRDLPLEVEGEAVHAIALYWYRHRPCDIVRLPNEARCPHGA